MTTDTSRKEEMRIVPNEIAKLPGLIVRHKWDKGSIERALAMTRAVYGDAETPTLDSAEKYFANDPCGGVALDTPDGETVAQCSVVLLRPDAFEDYCRGRLSERDFHDQVLSLKEATNKTDEVHLVVTSVTVREEWRGMGLGWHLWKATIALRGAGLLPGGGLLHVAGEAWSDGGEAISRKSGRIPTAVSPDGRMISRTVFVREPGPLFLPAGTILPTAFGGTGITISEGSIQARLAREFEPTHKGEAMNDHMLRANAMLNRIRSEANFPATGRVEEDATHGDDTATIWGITDADMAAVKAGIENAFGHFGDWVWDYTNESTDWKMSMKASIGQEMVGFYLLRQQSVEEVIQEEEMQTVEDISSYSGKQGVEGIALVVDPRHRGLGYGKALKDAAETLPFDYLWGRQMKDLDNLEHWAKRRRVVAESDSMRITLQDVRNIRPEDVKRKR